MRYESTGEFIQFLSSKGIYLTEDHIAFIYFGKRYTESTDEIVNFAIETTLKVQVKFVGSFYIALLEAIKEADINNTYDAKRFVSKKQIVQETLHKENSI